MFGSGDSSHIVKLRGLPFSTTVDDVIQFLEGVEVVNGKEGVHLTEVRPGRPSGECFVEVCSQADVDTALKKDKENMGKRYIEVFSTDRKDMEWALNAMRQSENGFGGIPNINDDVGIVKLRGLPFGCSKEEIVQFFNGIRSTTANPTSYEHLANGFINGAGLPVTEDGVHLLLDHTGRASGEAFVQFPDRGAAQQALSRDREKIGHRYIEVFLSTPEEVRSYGSRGGDGFRSSRVYRPTPYDRNDRFQGGRFGRGGGRGGYASRDTMPPIELTMEEQLKYYQEDLKYSETLNDKLMQQLDEKDAEIDDLRRANAAFNTNFEQLKSLYDESQEEVASLRLKVESFGRMFTEHEAAIERIRFLEEQLKDAQDRLAGFPRDDREFLSSSPLEGMSGGGYGGGLGSGLGRGGFRGRGGGGFCVHMRGLPFKASPQDIAYFFKPIRPLDINILYDNSGRPSGEADVEFECHEDAMRAMRRDKNNMDNRYIELFLNSSPGGGGGGGFKPRNFRY